MTSEEAFKAAMLNIYKRADAECSYRPTYLLQMIDTDGGVGAAKRLLKANHLSAGFSRLWELGRLDLTVEALVLDRNWADLFSADEKEVARRRLSQFNYKTD